MPVPVIRFERRERIRWGVVRNDKVFAMQGEYATTEEFIRAVVGNEELLARETDAIPRSEVTVRHRPVVAIRGSAASTRSRSCKSAHGRSTKASFQWA